MKKIVIKTINIIKGLFIYLFFALMYPFAIIFLNHKKIWIITERENEARDNGFVFFKYIREKHPEINCFYSINKKSADYKKICSFKNIIDFGSLKHCWYFCGAKYIISSTIQAFCPNYFLTLLRRKIRLPGFYVYLKHGIIKDNLTQLYKPKTKFNLFICGAKPEYDYVIKYFGYKTSEVVYTGLARFDNYHDSEIKNKNIILVMPTWRRSALEESDFDKSNYFNVWSSFLNNAELDNILCKYGVFLYFYPHPLFQKYANRFSSKSKNIIICSFDEYDLQDLILKSSCFITDFSSLAFDFAYMKKPIIYYQYDSKFFYSSHYKKGYFDYKNDGFGYVLEDEHNLIGRLNELCKNQFKNESLFLSKIRDFYPLHDSNNCERIYQSIISSQKR